ncbi:hypothetical protein HPB47_009405 [Ixodes persulcatus]|uniref:Uncharacterized protein n=1 Tax=Ixodes persulcatus TaxID=34615 RepID=A0AC60P2A2_IXOPE|nr:hypothetical protein HPB47_009405 [Ixodes persulcatus]
MSDGTWKIPCPRPSIRNSVTIDWSWVEDLRKMHPDSLVVIGGDFNTRHTSWGSRTDTYHGSNLVCAMKQNHLSLLNDPDLPTRVGQHARQGDTTTDLTWTKRRRALFWELGADTWGSDHLPIFIRLRGHKITAPKRTTSVVCWDAFRAELKQTPVTTSGGDPETHELVHLLRTIHEAKRSSTQQFQVAEDKPSPDLHLANLWQQHLDALCAYRERGRTPGLRWRLNLITAEARAYAKTLSTDRWCDLCSSFNGNMSGPRIWHIFRNWQGKAKRRTAAQTAALCMRISEEQLALRAGAVFFPQPVASPDPTIYSRDSATPTQMIGDFQALDLQAPEQVDMDQPFQMAELHAALARANARSALGPDLITISELRNLPELHLQLLLDAINEIWTTGNSPSSWRESLLYAHGGMNLLSELAEQALLAQRDRLSSSTAGLSILEELRVSPSLDVRPADAVKNGTFGKLFRRPGLTAENHGYDAFLATTRRALLQRTWRSHLLPWRRVREKTDPYIRRGPGILRTCGLSPASNNWLAAVGIGPCDIVLHLWVSVWTLL